mgnify:CR=1 FL=1
MTLQETRIEQALRDMPSAGWLGRRDRALLVLSEMAALSQEEIARRDRALVASYTTEAEIDLARNRSLQTINNVILSSQAFSEQLTKRRVDVEARKAESHGKAVAVLDREDGTWEALLRQADAALYRAKNAGRDRIVLAAP